MRMRIEQLLQQNTSRMSRFLRRSVALALAVAMMLPMAAMAYDGMYSGLPVQVSDTSEFPKIEIETNFVRTEFGTLTDYVELALRAGPSEMDETDPSKPTPIPVTLHSLAVTLQYNPKLFQAVSWSYPGTEEKPDELLELTATEYYALDLAAKKNDDLPSTGAVAQCGIVTGDANATANVKDGTTSLLFFKAESYSSDVELTEMTTLAVVRFKMADALRPYLSIEKDGAGYKLLFTYNDGTDDVVAPIASIADLDAAMVTAMALPSGTDLAAVKKGLTLTFAEDEDIAASNSPVYMAVDYVADANGEHEYYFVPRYNPDDNDPAKADDPDGIITASTTILVDDGMGNKIVAPKTEGGMVEAYDDAKPDGEKYSYTSNLIPAANITFPVVSEMSFADSLFDKNKYTMLIYVDWDDTIIGTQIVPRNADIRQMVSDYVAESFIYHDDDLDNKGILDLDQPTLDDIKSDARVTSYRGVYPSVPMADKLTDEYSVSEAEGARYPLTNKLDYGFLLWPMVKDEDAKDGDGNPTNTWVQKTDKEGNAVYDEEAPFAYGWAQCTLKNYKDIWTTLGMGEMGNLNSNSGWNGANAGQYKKLADGTLGRFTYYNSTQFKIADLEKGFTREDGDTIVLKAIYRPTENLLGSGSYYRLLNKPYYNKLNDASSTGGAAYSVDITLERANAQSGVVRGVARIREISLRMETTSDIRWDNSSLKNATVEEQNGRAKSANSNVAVENKEKVDFQLVLSARFNKVDYYLTEAYGNNFVSGTQRSDSNNNFTGDSHVEDNFLYMTDANDNKADAKYYRAPYDDRVGTYGFVLLCTLNNILEYATRVAELPDGPEKDDAIDTFYGYASVDALNDVNFRIENNKINNSYRTKTQNAILAAVQEAYDSKESKYWDEEHQQVKLTWHQLQHYISDYYKTYNETTGKGTATLLAVDTAENDSHKIAWCNLHEACASSRTGKPKNWNEIIALAVAGTADDKKKLALLSQDEIEGYTHLRSNTSGAKFAGGDDFADAIVAAVDGGSNTTWDAIQAAICGEDVSDAVENYWWYDGSTSAPNIRSLADIIAAAQDAITAPSLPAEITDGSAPVKRYAKLSRLREIFEKGFGSKEWINATENLASDYDAGTDTPSLTSDYAAFRQKLLDALATNATSWEGVQNAILSPVTAAELWWHNGAKRILITDLASMLYAVAEGSATWDSFDFAKFGSTDEVKCFRTAFNAAEYNAASFAAEGTGFKALIETFVSGNKSGKSTLEDWKSVSWETVQYYLIHGESDQLALLDESGYYWWSGGKEAPIVSFAKVTGDDRETRANEFAAALMEAAYQAKYNGNTVNAWKQVAEDSSLIKKGRLVTDVGSDFEQEIGFIIASLSDVKDVALNLVPNNIKNHAVSWEDIQKELISAYSGEEYWWKKADTQGNTKQQDYQELQRLIGLAAAGDDAEDTLHTWFDEDMAIRLGFTLDEECTWGDDYNVYLDAIPWKDLDYDGAGCLDGGFNISWEQILSVLLYCLFEEEWGIMDQEGAEDYIAALAEDDIIVTNPFATRAIASIMTAGALAEKDDLGEVDLARQINDLRTQVEADGGLRSELADNGQTQDDLIAMLELLTGKKVVLADEEEPVPEEKAPEDIAPAEEDLSPVTEKKEPVYVIDNDAVIFEIEFPAAEEVPVPAKCAEPKYTLESAPEVVDPETLAPVTPEKEKADSREIPAEPGSEDNELKTAEAEAPVTLPCPEEGNTTEATQIDTPEPPEDIVTTETDNETAPSDDPSLDDPPDETTTASPPEGTELPVLTTAFRAASPPLLQSVVSLCYNDLSPLNNCLYGRSW